MIKLCEVYVTLSNRKIDYRLNYYYSKNTCMFYIVLHYIHEFHINIFSTLY